MSYQISKREKPAVGIKRVLLKQIDTAIDTLWSEGSSAECCHELRVSCKRIRAALNLVKHTSPYVFLVENQAFANLSRSLSTARDRHVLSTVLQQVYADSGRGGDEYERVQQLLTAYWESHSETSDPDNQLVSSYDQLCQAKKRISKANLNSLSRKHLRQRFKKNYSDLGHLFRYAFGADTAVAFHALRKQGKRVFFQYRLLRDQKGVHLPAKKIQRFNSVLGDYHDLCNLHDVLTRQVYKYGSDLNLDIVVTIVEQQSVRVKRRIKKLGKRLFGPVPANDRYPVQTPMRVGKRRGIKLDL